MLKYIGNGLLVGSLLAAAVSEPSSKVFTIHLCLAALGAAIEFWSTVEK